MSNINGNVIARFFKYVNKTESCWLWIGGKTTRGYGAFKPGLAHRFSYLLHYGGFDKSLNVLHKCDTPACVNPNHLFIGTQLDNMTDMVSKGRYVKGKTYKGEESKSSKLTLQQVLQIRFIGRGLTLGELAEKYSVSRSLISLILLNKVWA